MLRARLRYYRRYRTAGYVGSKGRKLAFFGAMVHNSRCPRPQCLRAGFTYP